MRLIADGVQIAFVACIHNGFSGRGEHIGIECLHLCIRVGDPFYIAHEPGIAQSAGIALGHFLSVAVSQNILGVEHVQHLYVVLGDLILDQVLILDQFGSMVAAHAFVVIGSIGV